MTKAGLFNKGYHSFVDNFYTSHTLAEVLYNNQTLMTGSLCANRKGVSTLLKEAKPTAYDIPTSGKSPFLLFPKEKKSQKTLV